jgi:hypothetical protein
MRGVQMNGKPGVQSLELKEMFLASSRLARIKSDTLRDTAKIPLFFQGLRLAYAKRDCSCVLHLINRM